MKEQQRKFSGLEAKEERLKGKDFFYLDGYNYRRIVSCGSHTSSCYERVFLR